MLGILVLEVLIVWEFSPGSCTRFRSSDVGRVRGLLVSSQSETSSKGRGWWGGCLQRLN